MVKIEQVYEHYTLWACTALYWSFTMTHLIVLKNPFEEFSN